MPLKKSTKKKQIKTKAKPKVNIKTTEEEAQEVTDLQELLPDSEAYYVSPKAFSKLILEYYKTDDMTDDLVKMAKKIAERLAYKPNFINYTYREDMVGDAIIKMVGALKHKKFNPAKAKGNPFSYFTKIAINAFKNRIKKEKKQHEAIMNYQEEVYNQIMHDVLHQNQAKNTSEVDFSD